MNILCYIIGFTVILLTIYIISDNYNYEKFTSKNDNIKLDHLKLANQLCNETNDYPQCKKFNYFYDRTIASFKRLKKIYCGKNPKECKNIGL